MLSNLLPLAILAVSLRPLIVPVTAQAIPPVATMTVSNINASPDGFTRPVVAVNGQHPPPPILANKGDDFQITVVNNLDDPTMLRQTSVHWHGIFVHKAAWADGPDGVTQCPIAQSGDSFTYSFDAGNEAGTFWYHSHYGTQYCDGLRGPLVIYDDNDPYKNLYDVDDESTIITLADWYHLPTPSIAGIALSDATLINGKGRRPGGPLTDIEIVNVQPGTRYRFRLISMACEPTYKFSIDGHNMTIIEADGQLTEPHTVQEITIFTGQRYSFILEANQPVGNYWIRAIPNLGARNLPDFSSGGINSAILRYAGARPRNPTTRAPRNPVVLKEANLRTLLNPGAPGGSGPADENIVFNLALNAEETGFVMNGVAWANPDIPVMVQLMNGVPAEDIIPQGAYRTLPRNSVVEVSIPGFEIAGPHPFHLHGHAFDVVRSAGSDTYNYVNPVRRDVVDIGGAGDNVTIRFRTDNPGPWFFHCHVEFHIITGLAMVFLEAPGDIASNSPPPPSWDALCPKFKSLPANATSIQIVPTPTP
ncbi:laccase 5 [Coprinopsis cinerea okayama7|uniref:Laccase 10 n=1 Tax=Coprinopsis cinerea (strain Okayama-7 / 130 / ATCC MYA-4618 / FGSC 9003) TaxID=240176 RepID=Q08AB7_COPC7|nr:laccase 5 [Coprinopsis cinerea okayama7\|eukprot:XP_001829810.2 laccase 5 [Coprinopsis cinerea okayama7\